MSSPPTEDQYLLPWERIGCKSEDLDVFRNQAARAIDPEPEGSHFLVIVCGRISSEESEAELQKLMEDMRVTGETYDRLLRGPELKDVPEGQLPAMRMRVALVPWCHRYTMSIPTVRSRDPFISAFIDLFKDVRRANNHNQPKEIHFLLQGIPGFAIDIRSWGNFSGLRSFFSVMLEAENDLVKNIYLIPVVEPHIVDGRSPESLRFPEKSKAFHQYGNKYIAKYRLSSIISRSNQNRENQNLKALHMPQDPDPTAEDLWADPHWDMGVDRNDEFLNALTNEWELRSEGIEDDSAKMTVMSNRQMGRNKAWRHLPDEDTWPLQECPKTPTEGGTNSTPQGFWKDDLE